ncbi:phosphotransferase [Serratia plymuthica]|uniref:phosphotransferase n=1 Tax=Serratia plymuthica TaxID=82996 RepID=UPI001604CDF0|nr:phosphotransferase [Serratia plymuthica]
MVEIVSHIQDNSTGPSWIHADIQPGNLLVNKGKLAVVIDWGGMAIGDPAVDLIVAWNLLDKNSREVFKRAVDTDTATWREAEPGYCRLA